MTRLDVAKLFVELSGRYDLVVDAFAGNYSDKGIGVNFYLNEASKWLDARVDRRKGLSWYRTILPASERIVRVKRLRTPVEVWVGDEMLEPASFDWLIRNTGSGDNPTKWSWGYVEPAPNQSQFAKLGAEVLGSSWTLGADWQLTPEGFIEKVPSSNTSSATQSINVNSYNTYELSFVANVRAGSFEVAINNTIVKTVNSSGFYKTTHQPSASGSVLFELRSTTTSDYGWFSDLSLKPILDDDSIFEKFSFINRQPSKVDEFLVVDPPPSADTEIRILGRFYEPDLVNDSDENFWTANFPMALVQTALMLLESTYRNTEGFADYRAIVQDHIRTIEQEIVDGETNFNRVIG